MTSLLNCPSSRVRVKMEWCRSLDEFDCCVKESAATRILSSSITCHHPQVAAVGGYLTPQQGGSVRINQSNRRGSVLIIFLVILNGVHEHQKVFYAFIRLDLCSPQVDHPCISITLIEQFIRNIGNHLHPLLFQ